MALDALPSGYSVVHYKGARWGITVQHLSGGRQTKLFGEDLGGNDYVSFNLYRTTSGKVLLKPCEMPAQKVVDFVLAAEADLDFHPADHSTISNT